MSYLVSGADMFMLHKHPISGANLSFHVYIVSGEDMPSNQALLVRRPLTYKSLLTSGAKSYDCTRDLTMGLEARRREVGVTLSWRWHCAIVSLVFHHWIVGVAPLWCWHHSVLTLASHHRVVSIALLWQWRCNVVTLASHHRVVCVALLWRWCYNVLTLAAFDSTT